MKFVAFFQDSGAPKTGLTPVITIRRLDTGAVVVAAAEMQEVGDGAYQYDFVNADEDLDYVAISDAGQVLVGGSRFASATVTGIEPVRGSIG